jgi:hypothetical protein
MLPEFSTWGQPFCGTGLDQARDDELGALGLRSRDIRSSRGGREQKARHRQWVEAAPPPRSGSADAMREGSLRQQ